MPQRGRIQVHAVVGWREIHRVQQRILGSRGVLEQRLNAHRALGRQTTEHAQDRVLQRREIGAKGQVGVARREDRVPRIGPLMRVVTSQPAPIPLRERHPRTRDREECVEALRRTEREPCTACFAHDHAPTRSSVPGHANEPCRLREPDRGTQAIVRVGWGKGHAGHVDPAQGGGEGGGILLIKVVVGAHAHMRSPAKQQDLGHIGGQMRGHSRQFLRQGLRRLHLESVLAPRLGPGPRTGVRAQQDLSTALVQRRKHEQEPQRRPQDDVDVRSCGGSDERDKVPSGQRPVVLHRDGQPSLQALVHGRGHAQPREVVIPVGTLDGRE